MSEVSQTSTQPEELTVQTTPGDLQNIQPVFRLNGTNYLKWSQFVRTFLKGKGKLGHLLGSGPEKEDPKFTAWDEEDSMVMSWLWNAMVPEISDTVMFLSTAQEIWEAIRQTYSKVDDAAQVFEIKTKLAATKQGSRSVTEYANLLKNLWHELDYYQVLEMKNSKDAAVLKTFIEKDRTYDFLAGLNVEFDPVRVQILGKGISSLNEAIAVIRAEESRRGVMLDVQSLDGSALLTTGANEQASEKSLTAATTTESKRPDLKGTGKGNLICNYCKKIGHIKENCWKLHGRPQNHNQPNRNWGGKNWQQKGQAYATQTNTNNATDQPNSGRREFNKEDIDRLRFLLNSLEKPSGACSLALSGMFLAHMLLVSQILSQFTLRLLIQEQPTTLPVLPIIFPPLP